MQVYLHNKPEDLQLKGTQTYNFGGRRIAAHESPTGEDIAPGESFYAPREWYMKRRHWHFLEVVDAPADNDGQEDVKEKYNLGDAIDLNDFTRAEIIEFLKLNEVEHPSGALKADLLLVAQDFVAAREAANLMGPTDDDKLDPADNDGQDLESDNEDAPADNDGQGEE